MKWKIRELFKNVPFFLFERILRPLSKDEDEQRREFILNVLLVSIILLLALQTIVAGYSSVLLGNDFRGANVTSVVFSLILFAGMYLLGRIGYARQVAVFFIGAFFILLVYALSIWGVDLPQGWLFFAIVIAFAGILVSTRASFLFAGAACVAIFVLIKLEEIGVIMPDESWKVFPMRAGDAIGAGATFLIFTVVSWLSNREIEKSLARARASEAALQVERDQLEIKVEERTKQLKEAQEIQMEQMTRFAEFGQLASGIMHDLANPLTSMSINLQLARGQAPTGERDTAKFMDQALQAAERMEELVQVARKQFRKRPLAAPFVLGDEIEQAVQLLQSKARPAHVRFDIEDIERIETVGSPLKFHRVILNLLANAIEAYADSHIPPEQRLIRVTCHEDSGDAVIEVIDQAGGISNDHLPKIFQPFFTTKATGSGIGLPTVKEILEKDFAATIRARNSGAGAIFEIRMPIRKDRP